MANAPYRPQQHDLVLYNGWVCRVPYPVGDEDTQIDLIRVPHGTYTPDVHISCLSPYPPKDDTHNRPLEKD